MGVDLGIIVITLARRELLDKAVTIVVIMIEMAQLVM